MKKDIRISEINIESITKENFKVKCPITNCGREIIGVSKDQILYNLQIHLNKHKRDEEKKK